MIVHSSIVFLHTIGQNVKVWSFHTWYSAGPVCTESGVESFGGVGGKENKCWPEDWWLLPLPPPPPPPPPDDCSWPTLSCGSCGQTNEPPHGLPGPPVSLGSLSHGIGPWKCGLHTCGDACDDGIREAARGIEKQKQCFCSTYIYTAIIHQKNTNYSQIINNNDG